MRPIVEQLRDAEVEQLHVAFVGDEDVGGLQIPMDDQPGVRVRDGARHQQEQAQPGANRQLPRVDVFVNRTAFDVLQREVRLAAARDAGVVQPCDVRVIEGGQDLALLGEPFGEASHGARRPLGSLSATGRFTMTSVRWASQTVPIPPTASLRRIAIRARCVSGAGA